MADNVDITAGTGTTIATDDCTSGHAQLMKLAYSADGNRTHVTADADGLLVNLGANNDVSLNAGTNAIGKLAANSGVDIGDVDVTSISAGTNLIGDVGVQVRATGASWDVFNANWGDTYTALTNSAQAVKASAGKFGGYFIYNPNSTVTYVLVYNVAAASVTVGTTTARLVFAIPAGSAANLEILAGVAFDTAIAVAAATTGGGNGAPNTALDCVFLYK